MERCGLDLLPWQAGLLDGIMGRGRDGLWASSTVGGSIPRQNGKTDGVEVPRMCHGMAVSGEWVLYTAQLQKTATETFERMRDVFESPVLKPLVRSVHSAVGRESIELRNGARVKFLARTRNGGRGQHADLLVFDEAQELTDAQIESFVPVISASRNPQTIYFGTPPTPDSPGTVFRRLRERARDGAKSTYWAEWSVDAIPADTSDESLWAETNPSLGVLILPRTIAREAVDMSADGFARERLGWWSAEAVPDPPVISPGDWRECMVSDPEPSEGERVAAGVKFSPDGSVYSLSVAAKGGDGPVLVECLEREGTSSGIGRLVDWIVGRRGELAMVAVDGREWTATLVQRLADLGFPKRAVHVMRTSEAIDACAMLSAAVSGRTVEHIEQPLLERSVETSSRRPIGREGWGFKGPDPTPIESVALAHWAVATTKRNPKRRMKVSV